MAMKNAKTYEPKIKKLLSGAKKSAEAEVAMPLAEGVRVLIESVLLLDATPRHVAQAFRALEQEFVDFNELRAAPIKEIVECLGKTYPGVWRKAGILLDVLNKMFAQANTNSLEYMEKTPGRDVRRHLRELGLPPFSEALVSQKLFGLHAVPVDPALVELLAMDGLIQPEAGVEETQAFLERIVPKKNGSAAHHFFREYVTRHYKALEKKRREDAERLQKEQEAAEKKAAEQAARKEQAEKKAEKKAAAAERRARAEEKKAAGKTPVRKKPAQVAKTKTANKKTAKAAKRKTVRKKKENR
jgi:hypothetical protein